VSLFSYEGIPLAKALALLSRTLDFVLPASGVSAHRFDSRNVHAASCELIPGIW